MWTLWKVFGVFVLLSLFGSSLTAQDAPVSGTVRHVSPDGTKILVTGADNISRLIDKTGRVLYTSPMYANFFDWSPDGTQLAFIQNDLNGSGSLVLLDPESLDVRKVNDDAPLWPTSWSPDSRWLLMGSAGFGTSAFTVLWERVTDTATIILDVSSSSFYLSYTEWEWSPDSRYIAFKSMLDQRDTLLVYDVYEKRLSNNLLEMYQRTVPLPEDAQPWLLAAWSPDSQSLAVGLVGDANVYLVQPETGTFRSFAYTGGQISSLNWSADGTEVYFGFNSFEPAAFTRRPSTPDYGLYRVSVADGVMTPIWP